VANVFVYLLRYGGQQLIQFVEVVAWQQVFLSLFEVNAQMLQLIVQDLAACQDVFVPILFTEPGVDFRAPAAGGHIAKVRVEPVPARVWLFLGDDFDLVAHLQLVGERHDASANFGADAAVTHIAVNVVGKVERR
jgi:hypothetical protein